MTLNPRIFTNAGSLYLEWDVDPDADGYRMTAPDGSIHQVGRNQTIVKLGQPAQPFTVSVASDYPADAETLTYPTTAPPALAVTQSIVEGSEITAAVDWTATANNPVNEIDFYIDAALKQIDVTPPYVYRLDPNALADGQHTFTVRALDPAGKTATSDVTASTKKPTPPPPTGTKLWGTNTSDNVATTGGEQGEINAIAEVGGNCPRIGSSNDAKLRSRSAQCRTAGFKQWVAIVSQSKTYFADAPRVIAYLKDYPEAIIDPVNEPNLGVPSSSQFYTPEKLAALCIDLYRKVKTARPDAVITTPSFGNSEWSGDHSTTPLAYLKRMIAAGFKVGDGCDLLNMHWYEPNDYYHIWTPDSKGESMVSVLGNPKFLITEFGKRSSGTAATETAQAQDATFRVKTLKAQPLCMGGHWYAMGDDADGVGGTGWGLRRTNASHKPSWDAYKAAIAG